MEFGPKEPSLENKIKDENKTQNIEKIPLSSEELTKEDENEKEEYVGIVKLAKFLETISCELKKEGLPVRGDCRVEMDEFVGIYSEETVKNNKIKVKKLLREIFGISSYKKIKKEIGKRQGTRLEMLGEAIFNKFLKKECIILRASSYDDLENGFDGFLIDRETGDVICAFDYVMGIKGELKKKIGETHVKNVKKGGVTLKYGVRLQKDETTGRMAPLKDRINGIPVFYLYLTYKYVRKNIRALIPSLDKQSDEEKKLFAHFISLLEKQIRRLESRPDLDEGIKKKIFQLKQILGK